MAGTKKIAVRQGRVIVFIDESGLSERPCRARTWAPRGQTPVLQYSFSWKQLSVIAGVSFWRFYFRLYRGTIRTPQVIEFLNALQATIGRKLLIIWDRLQAHRSKLVREHVDAQHGAIALEYLPAYAPELNPVECIWGYLKHHAMPNYCARELGDLAQRARRHLRSMQRRSTLVCAFWQQAELFRTCHVLTQVSIVATIQDGQRCMPMHGQTSTPVHTDGRRAVSDASRSSGCR